MAEGALYPFGHGLSYTTFAYGELRVASKSVAPGQPVIVECDVKNTGGRSGEEVVQLYFQQKLGSVTTYEMNLCGFKRIAVAPGESRNVRFEINPMLFEIINRQGKRMVEPGVFELMAGGSSEKILQRTTFEIR